MKQRQVLLLMQTAAAAALLAACGGGSDAPPPAAQPGPLEQVPDSASQSAAGMATYLKALVALAPEDKEPLDVSGFAPPVPDDAEPEPVP